MHFFLNVATVFVFYTMQHLWANLNVYVYYKEIYCVNKVGKGKAPLYELNIIPTDKDFVETVFFCTFLVDTHEASVPKQWLLSFCSCWHPSQCLVAWKRLDHLDGHGTQDELLRHKVEMGQGDIHRHVFLYIIEINLRRHTGNWHFPAAWCLSVWSCLQQQVAAFWVHNKNLKAELRPCNTFLSFTYQWQSAVWHSKPRSRQRRSFLLCCSASWRRWEPGDWGGNLANAQ